jgi:hypothetical protein
MLKHRMNKEILYRPKARVAVLIGVFPGLAGGEGREGMILTVT